MKGIKSSEGARGYVRLLQAVAVLMAGGDIEGGMVEYPTTSERWRVGTPRRVSGEEAVGEETDCLGDEESQGALIAEVEEQVEVVVDGW